MASKIEVNLDTSKEFYESYKCKQNDDLTLIANIFENGAAKDLTNCSIVIQARKKDNTYVIQNTDIKKLDKKFEANLVRDFTRASGETLIEVVLVEGGKQNTTFSFILEVVESVIKGAEESKDLITSLEVMQDAVVEIGKISEETKELIANSGAASKEEVNILNASLAENKQQVDILKPKVDSLASGSPKGTFSSLSALQSDTNANTPEGKKNIYLVTADGGWYYWNGTAWTKGGTYQGINIGENAIDYTNMNDRLKELYTSTPNEISECVIGSLNTTNGLDIISTTRSRTNNLLYFKIGDKIFSDTSIKFYGLKYDKDGTFLNNLFSFRSIYTFTEECHIKLVMAYTDDRVLDDVFLLTNQIKVYSSEKFNYTNYKIEKLVREKNDSLENNKPLSNKKWVVVGDSTTDSTVHTANKYHYWVSQDTGIEIINFGKSGTGFKRTEEKNTAFYQRVATIPTDADVVTIFGLGNDCSQDYTIGTINDSTEETWCGAVNKTIDIILQRCPLCNIALISPYQWGVYPINTENKMKELSQKLKEIAENRGIEFLDLYKKSSVRPNDVTFNSTYFYNGDKVHLNELGHKKFLYPKFKQLVLGMIEKLS